MCLEKLEHLLPGRGGTSDIPANSRPLLHCLVVLEVSAAIITDGSKVLCFQKGESKRPYLSYKFEFPGGKLEANESPIQAIIRELKEEIDFDCSSCSINSYRDLEHDYADFSVLIHYFVIRCGNPVYTLKEHKTAIWTPIGELHTLDWADADSVVAEIIEANGLERCFQGK